MEGFIATQGDVVVTHAGVMVMWWLSMAKRRNKNKGDLLGGKLRIRSNHGVRKNFGTVTGFLILLGGFDIVNSFGKCTKVVTSSKKLRSPSVKSIGTLFVLRLMHVQI